jgi:hypothetical protein
VVGEPTLVARYLIRRARIQYATANTKGALLPRGPGRTQVGVYRGQALHCPQQASLSFSCPGIGPSTERCSPTYIILAAWPTGGPTWPAASRQRRLQRSFVCTSRKLTQADALQEQMAFESGN